MLYGELPENTLESGTLRGVPVKNINPPKTAILRLPTSQEILDRFASQRSVRTPTGRGRSASSESSFVPNYEAELALFNTLRLDTGEPFDQYEATKAIARLFFHEVTSCERDGEQYQITLKTFFGDTVHTLNMPTEKDMGIYGRVPSVRVIDLPRGKQEVRLRLGPAIDLYDTVAANIKGYAANITSKDVPPHHKSAVVIELTQALDELEEEQVPNF